MTRVIVCLVAWVCLWVGTALGGEKEWVCVTTWEGQQINLVDYGFYESFTWDQLCDYKVERKNLTIDRAGAATKLSLKRVRVITLSRPEFTEHFQGITIELIDGTGITCDGLAGVMGVIGRDHVGDVRIPGRNIRSVTFHRPLKEVDKPGVKKQGHGREAGLQ